MSVVAREARRRWLLVGGAVAVLCLLPAAVAAIPTAEARVDPVALRRLVLASGSKPFHGYVDSQARFGIPDLPELGDVAGLFGGTTRMRAWYASARAWRVAVLDPTGERDIYRTATGTQVWDFERNQVTETVGDVPVRLPWAADLLPPDLARRLLSAAGDETVTALPARRIAGIRAAGLRMTPTDPNTTVDRVDVWADPASGLPLQVEVTGRGLATPVLSSRFLEVAQSPPAGDVLAPAQPPTAGYTVVSGSQVRTAIGTLPRVVWPASVAGVAAASSIVEGVAVYGDGASAFVVIALPGRYGGRVIDALAKAGATATTLPLDTELAYGGVAYADSPRFAYVMSTSVMSMVLVRREGGRPSRRTFLLAGLVTPELLLRAGTELVR